MPLRRSSACLAFALLAAACAAALDADLRLRFRVGDVLRYKQTNRSTAGVKRGEKASSLTTLLTQEIVRTTVEVDPEGNGTCTNRFDKVACEMTSGANQFTYDSMRPEDADKVKDPSLARFAGLAGKTIRIKISPTANVLALEGFSKVGRDIAAVFDAANPQFDKIRRQLEEGYADELMLKKSQAIAEVLPPKPVAAGGTWSRTGSLPSASVGAVALAFTYTFQGVEKVGGSDCAHIVGQAELSLPASLPPDCRFAGGKARLDRGAYATDVWLDLQRGFIRKATEHIEIELTASSSEVPLQTEFVTSDTEMEYLGDR